MILEYEKKQSIYAEDIEYVEDEEVLTANIIKTDYIPTNFEGSIKNFCLRDGHSQWNEKHNDFEEKIHNEWLEELGYSLETHYVNFETREIIDKNKQTKEYILNNFDDKKEVLTSEDI